MTSKTFRLNNEERTTLCRGLIKLHRSGESKDEKGFTRLWDKIKNEEAMPWEKKEN